MVRFFCSMMALIALVAGARADGLVLEAEGIMVLQTYPGGQSVAALLAQPIPDTAVVRMETGSRLVVLLPSDQLRELRGPYSGAVAAFPGVEQTSGPSPIMEVVQRRLAPLARIDLLILPRRVPEGESPVAETPHHRVLPGTIVFRWTSGSSGTHRLAVRESNGFIRQNLEVTGTEAKLPAETLESGRYEWQVTDDGGRSSNWQPFEVIPVDEAARLEAERSALLAKVGGIQPWLDHFLTAAFWESRGMSDMAALSYDKAAAAAILIVPALHTVFRQAYVANGQS